MINKEQFFINALKKNGVLKGVGDDGVVLDSDSLNSSLGVQDSRIQNYASAPNFKKIIIACDGFCEDVHFKRDWMSFREIAKKAMLVNISDIISMNATPCYALLSITLPNLNPSALNEIALGLSEVAKEYKIKFIGGDTMNSQKLSFHITLFGKLDNPLSKKPILRKKLLNSDVLFCTGNLGSSQYALNWLLKGKGLKGGRISHSKRFARFIAPKLRKNFISKVARFVHCGLDVSDGIYNELNYLIKLNHRGIKLFKDSGAFNSGEEYEFLCAIAKKDSIKIKRLAQISRTPLTPIGKVSRKLKYFKSITWHK